LTGPINLKKTDLPELKGRESMLAIIDPQQQIITAPRQHANMDPLAWLKYFNPHAAHQRVIDYIETLPSSRTERLTMRAYLSSLADFYRFSGAQVLHMGGENYTINFAAMQMPTPSLIGDYIAHQKIKGLSSSTVNRYLASIKHFLNALYQQDVYAQSAQEIFLIPAMQRQFDLAARVKGPPADRSSNLPALDQHGTRLTVAEINQLFESFEGEINTLTGKRDLALLYLGITSGLRASELARVTLSSITKAKEGYEVRVRGKRNNHDPISIDATAYTLITNFVNAYNQKLADDDPRRITPAMPVFQPLGKGDRIPYIGLHGYDPARGISSRAILKIVERRSRAALDAPITAHDMRRTLAFNMREAGYAWDLIQMQLRHKSIATTQRYVGKCLNLAKGLLSRRVHFNIPTPQEVAHVEN
jgi:site-specific recombinase XerD